MAMTSDAALSNESLLKSSFSSASSLMALQVFSRLFTFALNQTLFRLATPRAFGAAAIQFELILSSILFLSREGVRNTLLRVRHRTTTTMNLAFLPFVIGVPLAVLVSHLFVTYASMELQTQPYFRPAIIIYVLAALVELGSEPMHNIAMLELKTNVRVRAEGLGITVKSIATFLILSYGSKSQYGDLGLVAFAMGQLAYGCVMLGSYVHALGPSQLLPKIFSKNGDGKKDLALIDPQLLRLSVTMTSQSLVKHFLTEGDKLIISWFSPLKDQGGYAIAVNYGSLIARVLFQPMEETLRVFFSKILSTSEGQSPSKQLLIQASESLLSLLLIETAFSVILVIFGTAYIPILLPILLPQQYLSTSAPQVLSAWVWYIPVLALNGGLEAFVSSVATSHDLNRQSRWMIAFSFVYVSSAVLLYSLHFGDASLVYANVINLTVRVAFSLNFIINYFGSRSVSFNLAKVRPTWQLWLMSAVSIVLISTNNSRAGISSLVNGKGRKAILEKPVVLHVALGLILGTVCLTTWWTSSGRYLSILRKWKSD